MSRGPTETKSRILLTARSLFSLYGFDSTSLDDILNATGITKGAFYHYFNSKEHLCVLLLDEVVAEYQNLAVSINQQSGGTEQLRQWLKTILEKNISGQWINCRLIGRLTVQMQQLGPELQSRLMNFWKWYEGLYQNLFLGCGLDTQQASVAAHTLLCVMFGSIWLEKINPSQISAAELTESLIQAILKNTQKDGSLE